MVAYDAGDYKTIGSSMEFGGLVDGQHPSTCKELMSQIIGFFGDIMTETGEFKPIIANMSVRIYPNPSSDMVRFSFNMKASGPVKLEIADMTGRIVACPFYGSLSEGDQEIAWEIAKQNDVSQGIYLFRLITGTEIHQGKLIIKK
jgi:hypothetical protein